eukprot:m.230233 g.230233  ORF g.230233 m.230233 type:complete len:259 (+) comp19254_c1_seq16:732-1508(+)
MFLQSVLLYSVLLGRHMVKLNTGKSLKVKPENLKLVETFSGLGKGFFSSASTPRLKEEDEIEVLSPKNPGELPGQLPEVQEMLNAGKVMQENKDQWCTPDLLEKISKQPHLMKMMSNPQFATALTEFEKNPKGAMLKYGDNPQMAEFFKSFCDIMGNHLTGISDVNGQQKPTPTPAASNTSANTEVAVSSEDDRKLQEALARPEVVDALQDERVKGLIGMLKEKPQFSGPLTDKAMRDPDVARKLRILVSAGLLDLRR